MAKDFIVYVDFDSTLYDTPQFGQDLKQLISNEAHVSFEQVVKDTRQFVADPNLGGYDYESHIRSYDLDPNAMWAALEQLVATHNYLYEDSPEFMQALYDEGYTPHILSFGEERFQAIKITSSLGHLAGNTNHKIGFDVIMRKKQGHIAERHPGGRGVLIDDRPDQDLPDGFAEITLDRSLGLKRGRQKGAVYMVSDLGQAAAIIRSLNGMHLTS